MKGFSYHLRRCEFCYYCRTATTQYPYHKTGWCFLAPPTVLVAPERGVITAYPQIQKDHFCQSWTIDPVKETEVETETKQWERAVISWLREHAPEKYEFEGDPSRACVGEQVGHHLDHLCDQYARLFDDDPTQEIAGMAENMYSEYTLIWDAEINAIYWERIG